MKGFYDIYVASLNGFYSFKEITTKQQTFISKTLIAETGALKSEFLKGLIKILEENCVENIDIKKLTILDVLCIMLALKCVSAGEKILLKVTCPNCESVYDINIKADEIYNKIIEQKIKPKVIKINEFNIYCDLPTLEKESEIIKIIKNKNYLENVKMMTIMGVCRFIKKVTSNGKEIKYDPETFFDEFEMDDFKKIIDYVLQINSSLNKIVVYSLLCTSKGCNKNLKRIMSLNYQNLYSFYNLFCNVNLSSIYKDLYYLSKIGLSPDFIENLTTMERNIFWSIFSDEQQKKRNKKQTLI